MRTATVEILGEVHTLCLSTRAKLEIDERFGGLDKAFDSLKSEDQRVLLETTFGLLEIMMRAGSIYAKCTGGTMVKPLSAEEMFDLIGISELPALVTALRDAIINGVKREVEVETSKNA